MANHWYLYRDTVETCPVGESDITIILKLTDNYNIVDDGYDDDGADDDDIDIQLLLYGREWVLADETGRVLVNSTKDYFLAHTFEFQDTIFMDLCLSDSLSYVFNYKDDLTVKYPIDAPPVNGRVEILRDDVMIERLEGSFGRSFSIAIRKPGKPQSPPPPKRKGYYSYHPQYKGRSYNDRRYSNGVGNVFYGMGGKGVQTKITRYHGWKGYGKARAPKGKGYPYYMSSPYHMKTKQYHGTHHMNVGYLGMRGGFW